MPNASSYRAYVMRKVKNMSHTLHINVKHINKIPKKH